MDPLTGDRTTPSAYNRLQLGNRVVGIGKGIVQGGQLFLQHLTLGDEIYPVVAGLVVHTQRFLIARCGHELRRGQRVELLDGVDRFGDTALCQRQQLCNACGLDLEVGFLGDEFSALGRQIGKTLEDFGRLELEQRAPRLDRLTLGNVNAFHARHIGGRYDMLVAQDQAVSFQQDVVAEHVIEHREAENGQQQEIDRAPGPATHDALLTGNVVGTQTFLERLHDYLRTRCTLLGT